MESPPLAHSVLDLIGNTPMVELTRTETGLCRLFLKLENQNPGGSIKDRPARWMVEAAEADGRLKPGGTIIEGTAGNTGLGLALIARQKGYRMLVVMPDKMAKEKARHLRALGAEIVPSRSDVGKGHPDYYSDMATRLEKEIPDSFYIDQFTNPANVKAHETTTGPEILAQMDGQVDAFVAGVGTGGTITGVGRCLHKANPDVDLVLADPVGSILEPLVSTGQAPEEVGSWAVEGIGEDYVPTILDLDLVTEAMAVSDGEAFETARSVLADEGILVGSSSGTLIAAALRYCRRQTRGKRVVTLACDTGNKYLNRMFDNGWMREEGFQVPSSRNDIGDLVLRRHDEGMTPVVRTDAPLRSACFQLREAPGGAVPVLDTKGRILGVLDEESTLSAARKNGFGIPSGEALRVDAPLLDSSLPEPKLVATVEKDGYAVIVDGDALVGIVTRMDLVRGLERAERKATA